MTEVPRENVQIGHVDEHHAEYILEGHVVQEALVDSLVSDTDLNVFPLLKCKRAECKCRCRVQTADEVTGSAKIRVFNADVQQVPEEKAHGTDDRSSFGMREKDTDEPKIGHSREKEEEKVTYNES